MNYMRNLSMYLFLIFSPTLCAMQRRIGIVDRVARVSMATKIIGAFPAHNFVQKRLRFDGQSYFIGHMAGQGSKGCICCLRARSS